MPYSRKTFDELSNLAHSLPDDVAFKLDGDVATLTVPRKHQDVGIELKLQHVNEAQWHIAATLASYGELNGESTTVHQNPDLVEVITNLATTMRHIANILETTVEGM